MSIRVIKKGLLDTIQDRGRYGYQHLGINPGGAMDRVAASVANMLAGNDSYAPVIEMHFPAAVLLFQADCLIALSGADFGAVINKQTVPLNTAIVVSKNAVLEFTGYKNGARCYLAVYSGWKADKWLNSYSTNLKVAADGCKGRALQKDDVLFFNTEQHLQKSAPSNTFSITNIVADIDGLYGSEKIACLKGAFYEHLTDDAKKIFSIAAFTISLQSDRMGYRLQSDVLTLNSATEILSSAVTRGTIQLLPSGQLIILMADHQTTGGYPVIAHVISSDVSTLAQKRPQETAQFQLIGHAEAELRLMHQHVLMQIQQTKLTGKLIETEIISGSNSLST